MMFHSVAKTVCFRIRQSSLSASSYPQRLIPPNPSSGAPRLFGTSSSISSNQQVEANSRSHTIHPPPSPPPDTTEATNTIRLSKLLAQHGKNLAVSRREAERMIQDGDVTVAGQVVTSPHFLISWSEAAKAIKVGGKLVQFAEKESDKTTKVWIVHKWSGEVVTKEDPEGRPSLMERLIRMGLGKRAAGSNGQQPHLKSIGRLDMTSEGLILVTNDGQYARDMELPFHRLHRTYRVRVHGQISPYKLKVMRNGVTIDDVRYGPMKVQLEVTPRKHQTSTNQWLRITCTEGKNRQIRRVMKHLGLNVTRLIRISYGDYQLDSIPPGAAVEVPVKLLEDHKQRGPLLDPKQLQRQRQAKEKIAAPKDENKAKPIQWVTHVGSKKR